AVGRKPSLSLFGTDYETPDGTAIRDYVHVCDLAAAHICALNYLLHGGRNISLNLGAERGDSVRQVLREIETVTGLPVPVRICAARAGDPPVLVGASHNARRTLNWRIERSSLSTIIADAWTWHRKRFARAVPHVG